MSGYFEPNNTLDDAMYGQEEMDDEDEDEDGIEGKLDSDSEDSQEIEVK